jgi:UDP-N-acetyl-D-galactosamine dehydrogenase
MSHNDFKNLADQSNPIAVVGLGYVGLPLATLLATKFKVIGFDVKKARVDELSLGIDRTGEVTDSSALKNPNLTFTTDARLIAASPLVIVAVPTPVDEFKVPDLGAVIAASETVGANLRKGATVVFESTVYPGVTEKICGPKIALKSGLVRGKDFFLGYSPERVNPGDKKHTIDKIIKVVAGENSEISNLIASVYGAVISAGIYRAPNIMTAEAAKVIENTQRDLNIALINELSMLFEKIGLDTTDVLEASGTKWNFLPFRPGLVGGHCIGVDPYYLTHLAESVGIHPQVIQAGRRINDGMAQFVAQKCMSLMLGGTAAVSGRPKVGILGVTFKENVPDVRNTKVVDLAASLEAFGAQTWLIDPVADVEDFEHEYRRKLSSFDDLPQCDAIVLAVNHSVFSTEYPLERLVTKLSSNRVVLDLKATVDRKMAAGLGVKIWRM